MNQTTSDTLDAKLAVNQKPQSGRHYETPRLIVFGAVHVTTQGSGGGASDSSINMTKVQGNSDSAIKTSCVRVGSHRLGFGLYLFDYKPEFKHFGTGRQFGVMAQEVEKVVPEAVTMGEDGYRRVNYAMLGITRCVN